MSGGAEIATWLAWGPALLIGIQFVAYCATILMTPTASDAEPVDPPDITVLLPAHDEADHIEAKLANLLDTLYPASRLSVIVVDDGSSDDTLARVESIAAQSPERLRVVQLAERRGKVSALLAGLAVCDTDIVICTDATSRTEPASIPALVRHFADPVVGGVTCRVIVANRTSSLAARCQSLILRMQNAIKSGESTLDSAAGFSGPLYGFRRSALGEIAPDLVLEDRVLAIQLRQAGARLRYADDAVVLYHSASRQSDFQKQKTRIMAGAFESLRLFWPMLWNPRYGTYGLWILPEYIVFRLLRPFLLLVSAAGVVGMAFSLGPEAALRAALGIGLLLLLAFTLGCFCLLPRMKDRRGFLVDALVALPFVPVLLLTTLSGGLRIARGRHSATWERVKRDPNRRE
jgi:cellulose synthase/poly-beta-1,6-N-acetylglucosamine synthase-like glycosyltransferase